MSATLTREAPVASVGPAVSSTDSVTLTIARNTLRTALGKLAAAVDTTSKALPVAQHIRVDVAPGRLTMTATDFSTFVRLSVPCDAAATVTALLPAKRLSEIVASLPPVATVSIALSGTLAVVTAGRSRFELPGMDPAEFPLLPTVETAARSVVSAAPFLDALDRAVVHASDEDSRPAINVVRLDPSGSDLHVAAIHGHHLARLPVGAITGEPLTACSIHRLAVPVLTRLYAGLPDGTILSLAADASRLIVEGPDSLALLRLVDLDFPTLGPVIGSAASTQWIECDRLLLAAAIKRVALAAGQTRRVAFAVGDDLSLRAADSAFGKADDVVPIQSRSGAVAPLRIGVNASYALAALATLTAPSVTIGFATPDRALTLRNADQAPTDPTLVLIMPLRLPD